MTIDDSHVISGNKRAFIRDGALILYFDTSEAPFVARFDLDSLAQAKFEIEDKRESAYILTLRDFSGEAQDVGRFNTKAEAHQALHAILQALVSHSQGRNDKAESFSGKSFLAGAFKWFVKALIIAFIVLLLLWIVFAFFITPAPENGTIPSQTTSSASPVSNMPAGEAIDADAILGIPNSDKMTAE